MRKAVGFAVGAAMLAAVPATAAVPLHLQRRGELRAVLDLPALLTLGPIERIERIAADMWRVTAGRCHIDVRMVAVRTPHSGLAGPLHEPRAGRRVCGR